MQGIFLSFLKKFVIISCNENLLFGIYRVKEVKDLWRIWRKFIKNTH